MSSSRPAPNPRRVAAGKRNRALNKGPTPEGRERLLQAALANRPWEASNGPRLPRGKAASALNGKAGQKGELSVRELRAELAGLTCVIKEMARCRALALDLVGGGG